MPNHSKAAVFLSIDKSSHAIRVCAGFFCTGENFLESRIVVYSVFQVCIFRMSPLPYLMLQLGHPLIRLSMRA